MPEVLGNPPSPRVALFWNGAAWQWALVDAAGHLQIDALSTVMDPLAATAAAQALALAQLQLIEDMRNALQSVATDRLIVRGEDQLFSIAGLVSDSVAAVISGANGYIDSTPVGAGTYWVITNSVAWDATTATTRHTRDRRSGGVDYAFDAQYAAFGVGIRTTWSGLLFLGPTDVVRCAFLGGIAGDNCRLICTGYRMTIEV